MPRSVRPLALSLLFGATLVAPVPSVDARERSWEIAAGFADEIEGEGSEVFTLGWLSSHEHPYEVVVGHIRERNDDFRTPSSTFVGASKRFYWRRWFASAGVALTDVENDVLSSTGQFLTGAGYAADRWTISLRHLSNADTGGRNRGETFLLFAYRF